MLLSFCLFLINMSNIGLILVNNNDISLDILCNYTIFILKDYINNTNKFALECMKLNIKHLIFCNDNSAEIMKFKTECSNMRFLTHRTSTKIFQSIVMM